YGDMSPAAIARQFGISVRKLHLLFEGAPTTFSQTVMRIRSQQCAQDLLANHGRITLTDLAAKWGFSDLTHLNRVFRQHFGCRASEYARLREDLGVPLPSVQRICKTAGQASGRQAR